MFRVCVWFLQNNKKNTKKVCKNEKKEEWLQRFQETILWLCRTVRYQKVLLLLLIFVFSYGKLNIKIKSKTTTYIYCKVNEKKKQEKQKTRKK